MACMAVTEHARQEAGVTSTVLAPSPLVHPSSLRKVWDPRKRFPAGAGGRNGLGPLKRKGHSPLSWVVGDTPIHTHTHRITPIEKLHFLCVLGKCKTGTQVLRKDKGGGSGRWPGFSPRHKGQLSEGGKSWATEHMLIVPEPRRRQQLWGEVTPGPPGSPWPLQAGWLGREAAAPARRNLSLAVCEALPSPLRTASARKRICLMQTLYKQILLLLFAFFLSPSLCLPISFQIL